MRQSDIFGVNTNDGEALEDPTQYRRLIGRLIYLTITRPDILYPVHILSQFMHTPQRPHIDTALRLLRYLKGSPGKGILLSSNSSFHVTAFCDADCVGCLIARRSTTAYCTFLGSSPISWKTKKQHTVSQSSAEAEYKAMAQTTCELQWLQYLLCDLGISHPNPMTLYCDNQATLHIAAHPVFHERAKHIEIDCHFICEKLQSGLLHTSYTHTTK